MISNGFDETMVMNAALGRIGFRNGYGEYAIVDSDNQQSASGRYFQDFHSAVTIPYLKQTQQYYAISDAEFNQYLVDLKKSVISTALNSVFNRPQEVDHPRMLFDRLPNTNYVVIPNTDRFVGWTINLAKGFYSAIFNSATFYFDGDATFNLHLFQDGKKLPIKIKEVTVEANNLTIVDLSDWVIRAVTGSNYYIGYFQSELGSVQAYDVSLMDVQRFHLIGFQAMSAIPTDGNTNFQRTQYAPNWKTYGLNLEITTYNDYTNEVVKNINLFDNLIGLQMAIRVLEQSQYTSRSNAEQRIIQESEFTQRQIDRDLNQARPTDELPFTAGIREQYNREVIRVSKTFFPKKEVTSAYIDDYNRFSRFPFEFQPNKVQ